MFKHILVVCVGNICRSPVAEALLKKPLQASAKTIESAGIHALVGRSAEPLSIELMQEQGIDISAHRAQQLTKLMLLQADLVLTMEQRHIEDISHMAPEARGKIMLLGHWLKAREIPDPYRQQRTAFEHTNQLISDSVAAWIKYL